MNEFTVETDYHHSRLLHKGVVIADFCPDTDMDLIGEIVSTLNAVAALPEKPVQGGPTEEDAACLFDHEGVIYLDNNGGWYTNQTGGVSCNHPKAQGRFVIYPIPEGVKRALYDCCYADDGELDQCDRAFREAGLPWKVDRCYSNEEAWLHVNINGEPAILTWENSD